MLVLVLFKIIKIPVRVEISSAARKPLILQMWLILLEIRAALQRGRASNEAAAAAELEHVLLAHGHRVWRQQVVGRHSHQHLTFVFDVGHKLVECFEPVLFVQVNDFDLFGGRRFFADRWHKRRGLFGSRGGDPRGVVAVDAAEHDPTQPLQL